MKSCEVCRRARYVCAGSNSSEQCVYHMLSILARRLPTHFIVVAALIVAFLAFNCVYALIVNRRQIVSRVSTQLSTPRALRLRQQPQQTSGQPGQRAGDEKRPLLTTPVQQQQQQQPQPPQQPQLP